MEHALGFWKTTNSRVSYLSPVGASGHVAWILHQIQNPPPLERLKEADPRGLAELADFEKFPVRRRCRESRGRIQRLGRLHL